MSCLKILFMKTSSIRNLLIIFLFFSCISSFSQESNEFNPPSITPVAPEAGAMMQYGSIPVNMSAGQMSFQVPIFNIEIPGGYSWPINLNYRYAGLILEGKPSISGLGWLLSGGGAVTREVRGLPDRHPYGIFGTANDNFVEEIITNNNDIPYTDAVNILANKADTELDKYTVNVGGVNFSFKIDENENPVYLSKHNYKVSFPNAIPTILDDVRDYYGTNNYGDEIRNFTVTDDQGIEYYFDQIDINEPKDAPLLIYNESNHFGYFSSWHLSKITYPNGEEITLNYIDDIFFNYDYSASAYKNIGTPNNVGQGSCNDIKWDQHGYNQSNSMTEIKRKLLTSISFSNGTIELNTALTNDNNIPRILYDQISVRDLENQPIIQYDLTYQGPRDLMTKITKNGKFYYEFEYFDNAIPSFFLSESVMPYQQDYWGFYNGRNNSHMINIPQTSISTDKRSNLFSTRKGAMNKIIYPTGGFSNISYEQNQIKKLYSEIEEDNYSMNRQILVKLETDNYPGAPTNKSTSFTYTFDHTVVALVSHHLEVTSSAYNNDSMSMSITNDCTPGPTQFYFDEAESLRSPENPIPDVCLWLLQDIDPGGVGGQYPLIYSNNSGGYIKIEPGTYTFQISTTTNNISNANGEIKIQFYEPEDISQDPYVNASVGGIRVSSISHIDNNGASTNKNYNYNDDSGLSTGLELAKTQMENTVEVLNDCYETPAPEVPEYDINYRYFYHRINYSSRSYNPINLNAGVPVFYKEVKEFSRNNTNSSGEIIIIDGGPLSMRAPSPGEPEFPTDTNPDGSLIFTVLGGGTSGTYTEELYTNGFSLHEFSTPSFYPTQSIYPYTPIGNDLALGRSENIKNYAFNDLNEDYNLRAEQQIQYLSKVVSPDYENHPHNIKFAQKRIYINTLRYPNGINDQSGGKQSPEINGSNNNDYFIMDPYREYDINYVNSQTTNTSKNADDTEITSTTVNDYDPYFNLKEVLTFDSNGEAIRKKFYYPYDTETLYTNMVADNHLSKVLRTESYKGNDLIGTQDIEHTYVNGDYKKINIKTSKDPSDDFNDRINFKYYPNGNIKTTYRDHNTPSSHGNPNSNVVTYIWGYNEQYPIAKIENVEYDVIDHLIQNLQNISDEDDDRTLFYLGKEGDLREALDDFRDNVLLSNARVTTYTYDPFIGVTSITDPRGRANYFNYDSNFRLISVKDEDGNILGTNSYNYINQN